MKRKKNFGKLKLTALVAGALAVLYGTVKASNRVGVDKELILDEPSEEPSDEI